MTTADYVMNMFNEDKCLMVQVKPLYETSGWQDATALMKKSACPFTQNKAEQGMNSDTIRKEIKRMRGMLVGLINKMESGRSQRINVTQSNQTSSTWI